MNKTQPQLTKKQRKVAGKVYRQIFLHPESHDQRAWATDGATREMCGTTACVAGWAAKFSSDFVFKVVESRHHPIDSPHRFYASVANLSGDYVEFPDAGHKALGLTAAQAGYLFSEYRKRDEVLKAIGHLALVGDWDPDINLELYGG